MVPFFLGAVTLLGAGPAPAATAHTLIAEDEQFYRDFAARGADGWIAHFADDAVLFRADGPLVRSRAELAAFYRRLLSDPGVRLTWKPVGGEISSCGDLGFTYGTWERTSVGADGKAIRRTGKYQTTWRLQKDGSWKIVADSGNPDAPGA